MKVLNARDAPDNGTAFRVWVFRILRNLRIDKFRRDRLVAVDETKKTPERQEGVHSNEDRLVNTIALRAAFERLSEDHRSVLSLVDLAGMSYAEAAETLGVPTGTVMSRVARGRKALAEMLNENDNVTALPVGRRRAGNHA